MYLRLRFESASTVIEGSRCTWDDYKMVDGVAVKRTPEPIKDWRIPFHCMVNMIHVMCGYPPVAKNDTNSYFEWQPEILDKVSKCLIRYDYEPDFELVETEKGFYYKCNESEIFHSAKSAKDSHGKSFVQFTHPVTGGVIKVQGTHTWSAWKAYLGLELFNEVCEYLSKQSCIELTKLQHYTLMEVVAMTYGKDKELMDDVCNKISILKKTPIKHVLSFGFVDGIDTGDINRYYSTIPYVLQRGIKQKLTLNGDIIIEVGEEMIDRISQSGGFATILDGGCVFIEDIMMDINTSELLNEKYNKQYAIEN